MSTDRTLISTIQPSRGGVQEMVRFATDCLIEGGYAPVIAYYQPYSVSPQLSVPFFKLFRRNIGVNHGPAINGFEAHGFGAWLPELEFTHYLPTKPWRDLIQSCDHYLVVSGNCLPATAFALLDRPFLAWFASDWDDDRRNRAAEFPRLRKMLDRSINRHVIRNLEKTILGRGTVLALSRYTRKRLNGRSPAKAVHGILPIPVDLERFRPAPEKVVPMRVGFAGRLGDPRKNIGLLIEAAGVCRRRGCDVTLELIGGNLPLKALCSAESRGLGSAIQTVGHLRSDQYAERLQALDVFVIPSHQEGLCIAALEAMACGCPVISTRCGGPEEFVSNGNTGYLVDAYPDAVADAIEKIVSNRSLRKSLSVNARSSVEKDYHCATAKKIFWDTFSEAFRQ